MKRTLPVIALGWILLFAGCGGGTVDTSPPPQPGTAPVSVLVRDAPPAGVTVLSFEVTITGATLQPGNISLVSTPIRFELKRLEIETAFFNTINVPAGAYNSITVMVSNPEIVLRNDTGTSLPGCNADPITRVCKIQLNVAGTLTFNGPPFPLTVMEGSPIGLLLDINLNSIIQNDLSLNLSVGNGLGLTVLPPVQGSGVIEELEDLFAAVVSKDTANNTITVQITSTGQTIVVNVDSNTEFDDFDDAGLANALASVAAGQLVELDLRLLAGGMFRAREIELVVEANAEELEGTIVAVDGDTFMMVAKEVAPGVPGINDGDVVAVQVQPGASFRVDNDGLNVPTDLMFTGTGDLLLGQTVQVRRRSGSSGLTVVTDRVRLRMSRFTARVMAPGAVEFTIDNLPSLFTAGGTLTITVRTSPETDFDNVAGASSLATGDIVSLRGLLFRSGGGTHIVLAKKVRRR